MNETQKNRIMALEKAYAYSPTDAKMSSIIEDAKLIHDYLFGEEQAVPDKNITCKGSDTRIDYGEQEKDELSPIPKTFLLVYALSSEANEKTQEVEGYHCPNCGTDFYIDICKYVNTYHKGLYCPSCGK